MTDPGAEPSPSARPDERSSPPRLLVWGVTGIGEIGRADDVAGLIADAIAGQGDALRGRDVVVVTQKIVSKAEGKMVPVDPTDPRSRREVVEAESVRVLRRRDDLIITETKHGFVCANAGVDASNSRPGELVLLPLDPDASARALRSRLRELTGVAPGIVIADSFGRAWRVGQCDVAIGIAGLAPVEDWRGRVDRAGRTLEATVIAVADEAAAAADLARSKDSGEPAVLVRGLERHVGEHDGPGAAALVRARDEDLFL